MTPTFYAIPPGPPLYAQDYAYIRDIFTFEAVESIVKLGESKPRQQAGVLTDSMSEVRRTEIGWIQCDDSSEWLYRALGMAAAILNSKYFGFDLFGFVDELQYTVYHGSPESPGYYNWHADMAPNTVAPRKLSLIIPLSAPEAYEGGRVEIFNGSSDNPFCIDQTPGWVHAFPSWHQHRVTLVTKGIRRSLVAWISGPQFR